MDSPGGRREPSRERARESTDLSETRRRKGVEGQDGRRAQGGGRGRVDSENSGRIRWQPKLKERIS